MARLRRTKHVYKKKSVEMSGIKRNDAVIAAIKTSDTFGRRDHNSHFDMLDAGIGTAKVNDTFWV
jgi:hypothetical protein